MQDGDEAIDDLLEPEPELEAPKQQKTANERNQNQRRKPDQEQSADRGIPSVAVKNKEISLVGIGITIIALLVLVIAYVFSQFEPGDYEEQPEYNEGPAFHGYENNQRNVIQEWLSNNPPDKIGPPKLPEADITEEKPVEEEASEQSGQSEYQAESFRPKGMVTPEELRMMASQPMQEQGGNTTYSNNQQYQPSGYDQNPYAVDSSNIENALIDSITPEKADPRNNNLQFKDQVANQQVETVEARQLTGMEYRVLQGTFIHVTLDTAIDSTLPGEVRGTVAKHVYGARGNSVLVPKGSILYGTHNSDIRRGQGRVFVVWSRLITPDGYDIPIGSSGGDNLGRAGFQGEVNTHFWKRFGNATLLSLLGATLSNAGVDGEDQPNSESVYRQALSMSFQGASTRSLEENINIPDTIYKDQGDAVIVFVNRDLDFSKVMKDG